MRWFIIIIIIVDVGGSHYDVNHWHRQSDDGWLSLRKQMHNVFELYEYRRDYNTIICSSSSRAFITTLLSSCCYVGLTVTLGNRISTDV